VSQGGESESFTRDVTRDVTRPTERGYAPRPPYVPGLPRERRISAAAIGVGLTFVVAVAALVIAVVALTTQPAPAAPSTALSKPQVTPADDKALCQAIAPLMKENDDRANAFLGTGAPGSPERDGALPKFVSDTEDWARRTQAVLDAHANPPRFVTRALQRYIDDMQLFVASVRPGPGTQYDEAAWTDSIEAYGGPLATCQALGIGW
jgi:hypothetical protein